MQPPLILSGSQSFSFIHSLSALVPLIFDRSYSVERQVFRTKSISWSVYHFSYASCPAIEPDPARHHHCACAKALLSSWFSGISLHTDNSCLVSEQPYHIHNHWQDPVAWFLVYRLGSYRTKRHLNLTTHYITVFDRSVCLFFFYDRNTCYFNHYGEECSRVLLER